MASSGRSSIASLSGKLERVLLRPSFPLMVIVCATVVRVAWILLIQVKPQSDYEWYFVQGLRIAEGRGYTVDHDGFPLWAAGQPLPSPRPSAFWPVGYPAFLGLLFRVGRGLGDPLLQAKLANTALYVGIMLAMSYSARVIFRSKLAGRLALVMVGFIPNQIAYTALTSVEVYFAFLVACGVAALLFSREKSSRSALAATGVLFGLAALTKPQAVLLPGLLLILLTIKNPRRCVAECLLVYAPLALVLLPWTIRNAHAFDRVFFVSTNGWVNLFIGNTPGSFGFQGVMWNRELDEIVRRYHTELEWNDATRSACIRYVTANPSSVLLGLPGKLFKLYVADVDGFGWNRAADPVHANSSFWTPLRALSEGYYLVCLAGALLSARFARESRSPYFAVGAVVAVYFTLVYMVFFGGARYHFPIVPWFAAYAAGTLGALLEAQAPLPAPARIPSHT